jgi:hypothetical protein
LLIHKLNLLHHHYEIEKFTRSGNIFTPENVMENVSSPIRAILKTNYGVDDEGRKRQFRTHHRHRLKILLMAHANIHLNAITRSGGKSAVGASAYRSGRAITSTSVVAAAAYRSGECLQDHRDVAEKKTYDYTRKQNILASGMLAPDHAPEWARDREKYWNAVEARETRKNSLLAKEAVLVLPRDLSTDQQKQVVENWANKNLVHERGLVVDYAIHSPEASDGGKNPHAHVLYYPRAIDAEGNWGSKLTGYNTPGTVDGTKVLKALRKSYEDELNAAAKPANDNRQKVYDLRSYRERGINRIPQPKIGKKVTWLEKQGYITTRAKEMQRVMALNEAMQGRRNFVRSFSQLGSGGRHSPLTEGVRENVADTYYDVMYGDGTEGSHEKDRDFYGR